MHRPDAEQFINQTSFGFIPAGTSNGLYASVADLGTERDCVLSAAFVIAKGRNTKMDLTELTMQYDDNKLYMFLSFNYAIIADTDINSEWMRNLGSIRYTIRGIRNVVSVKHYDGELGFKGVQMINRN